MTEYSQCNLCNSKIDKDLGAKWWEIWKGGGGKGMYRFFIELGLIEKISLPKLINKPTEYNKLKAIVSKVKEVEKN